MILMPFTYTLIFPLSVPLGTFFLKIFYLKRNEFPLECVIHDSYAIYVYLNFPVISTALTI